MAGPFSMSPSSSSSSTPAAVVAPEPEPLVETGASSSPGWDGRGACARACACPPPHPPPLLWLWLWPPPPPSSPCPCPWSCPPPAPWWWCPPRTAISRRLTPTPAAARMNMSLPSTGFGCATRPAASITRMPVTNHVMATEARAPRTSMRWKPKVWSPAAAREAMRAATRATAKPDTSESRWAASVQMAMECAQKPPTASTAMKMAAMTRPAMRRRSICGGRDGGSGWGASLEGGPQGWSMQQLPCGQCVRGVRSHTPPSACLPAESPSVSPTCTPPHCRTTPPQGCMMRCQPGAGGGRGLRGRVREREGREGVRDQRERPSAHGAAHQRKREKKTHSTGATRPTPPKDRRPPRARRQRWRGGAWWGAAR